MSGPCFLVNQKDIASAALKHKKAVWLDELTPHGMFATLDYYFYQLYDFLGRYNLVPDFVFSFLPRYQLLPLLNIQRKGFQCHFRMNNSWEPNITNWTDPLYHAEGNAQWTAKESVGLPQHVHTKLTIDMLTPVGATQCIADEVPKESEREGEGSHDKQHYIGISGGGWRALNGHMGIFRALSSITYLRLVKAFSAVSGGSWFLSKLAFDEDFSKSVLQNETHITEVALDWMERKYFGVIRNTTCSHASKQTQNLQNSVGSFLSTAALQAHVPFTFSLATGIIAAHHYNYSWQKLVEDAVLGSNIAGKHLDNITLAAQARKSFGEATVIFNWNQLHRWKGANGSNCSKWSLKDTNDQYIQHPVYTSALYEQHPGNNDVKVDINIQGRPVKGLFEVCHFNSCPGTHETTALAQASAAIATMISTLVGLPPLPPLPLPPPSPVVPLLSTECADFNLGSLTVGQVASASSAAAGMTAVREWVHNIIELAQHKAKDALKGGSGNIWYCSFYRILFTNLVDDCNEDIAVEEFLKLTGCETSDGKKEDPAITAKRWSQFLEKMAVQMVMNSSSLEHTHAGHMAIDAVNQNQTRINLDYTLHMHDIDVCTRFFNMPLC